MDVTCVMISCEQREDARRATLPQLQTVGLQPRVFLSPCQPASQTSNGTVSGRALAHAASTGNPTLFVEDDIDLAPDFRWFLDHADPTVTTFFYLNEQKIGRAASLYGREAASLALERKPMPRQYVRARHYLGLYGSQCVLIPPAVVKALAIEMRAPTSAMDGHLGRYLERHRLPVHIALPHPVQHRNVRVARDTHGPSKYSISFDCPRLETA